MRKGMILTGLAIALSLVFNFNIPAAEKVKLGLAIGVAPEYYVPVHAAEEKGFFKRNGVNVEIVPFTSGSAFVQAFAASSLDIGATASGSAVHMVSKGVPVIIVSALISRAPFRIYVKDDSQIRAPKDLVGAKIGVPRLGSVSEFFGRTAVKSLGIDEQVRFVGAGGLTGAIAAVKSGAIDALVQPPSVVADLEVKGQFREIINIGDYLPKEWVEHVLVARKDLLNNNSNNAKSVVRAVLQANAFIKKNPDWALKKMIKVSNYSEKGVRLVYNYLHYVNNGEISKSAIVNVRDFLIKWQIIKKSLPVKELYTAVLLR